MCTCSVIERDGRFWTVAKSTLLHTKRLLFKAYYFWWWTSVQKAPVSTFCIIFIQTFLMKLNILCWINKKGICILSMFNDLKTHPARHIWLIWCSIANCILTHVMSRPLGNRRSSRSSSSSGCVYCLPTSLLFFSVSKHEGATIHCWDSTPCTPCVPLYPLYSWDSTPLYSTPLLHCTAGIAPLVPLVQLG